MRKHQEGFTLVEALLAVIALVLISFSGWYVWNSNQKDKEAQKSAASAQKNKKELAAADPTKGWKEYTSSEGKFSLKYPASWLTATNPNLCDPNVFLLGSTSDTVGRCGSDFAGQIYFNSFTVESGSVGLQEDYYDGIVTKTVTVDGVKGERQSGTFSYTGEGIGPSAGSKTVVYIFKTSSHTYTATYTQEPNFPDVLEEFDIIVLKTLKFN